jgi:enoyl-CoA hydratase/carnithine racemase
MDLSAFDVLHPTYQEELKLLTLNLDHGKANEMGTLEIEAFEALCATIESNDAITSLCTTSRRLSAKGKPIFIAGANVTERLEWAPRQVAQHVLRQRDLMLRLRRLPIFTFAVPTGVTLGWGVEFLLTADFTLAAASATFALPETGLGIIPGARGTAELAALVGPAQAMRLGCTGESIDAAEAVRIGLVQEVHESIDGALARVEAMATLLMRKSPTAIAAYKQALLAGTGRETAARLDLERQAYERCVASGEAAIGRHAFADIVAGKTPKWGPRKA